VGPNLARGGIDALGVRTCGIGRPQRHVPIAQGGILEILLPLDSKVFRVSRRGLVGACSAAQCTGPGTHVSAPWWQPKHWMCRWASSGLALGFGGKLNFVRTACRLKQLSWECEMVPEAIRQQLSKLPFSGLFGLF
jgi:hypothetical protein